MNGIVDCLEASISSILFHSGYECISDLSLTTLREFIINFLKTIGEQIKFVTEANNQRLSNLLHAKAVLFDYGIDINQVTKLLFQDYLLPQFPCVVIEKPVQVDNEEDCDLLIGREKCGIPNYAPALPESFHDVFSSKSVSQNELKRSEYKQAIAHTNQLKYTILKDHLRTSKIALKSTKNRLLSCKEHDSYLQNNFSFNPNSINGEINNDIFGINIINTTNCQNTVSNISPQSNISDLFSQSSNAINEDFKSNPNSLNDEILSVSQQQQNVNNNNNTSPVGIDLNANLTSAILFHPNADRFSSNTFIPANISPGLTIIQSCPPNNNNYMPYSNNYQYNSCTNTITIPNTTATQFNPCPQLISHRNDLHSVFDTKFALNQKSGNSNDETRRLERKREKNREAARKCRERKNQHVEVLESKLQKQQQAISVLKSKMKLVLNEMVRLDEYMANTDIPHCDLKDFRQIKDDVAVFLDLVESES